MHALEGAHDRRPREQRASSVSDADRHATEGRSGIGLGTCARVGARARVDNCTRVGAYRGIRARAGVGAYRGIHGRAGVGAYVRIGSGVAIHACVVSAAVRRLAPMSIYGPSGVRAAIVDAAVSRAAPGVPARVIGSSVGKRFPTGVRTSRR
jgi:hypothetical protein